MTDTITPALSAKEWDSLEVGDIPKTEYLMFVEEDGSVVVMRKTGKQRMESVAVDSEHLPTLIALANHALPDSDPRKITREQVDALADVADKATVRHWHDAHYAAPHLRALVAALRALLPP
jgi:hypothetical protein